MNVQSIIKTIANRDPSIMGIHTFNHYAVLVPFLEQEGETHVLFEVRSLRLRTQPGDICFPGGRVDPTDENEKESAIRETMEELGIERSIIQDVFPIDYVVSPNKRIIYPFVGTITTLDTININRVEVEEVFTVPLSFFFANEPQIYKIDYHVKPEADFPYELIQQGKKYDWRPRRRDELFYIYNNRVIWGLTARIVHYLIQLLRKDM